ncbi:MAG: PQQ-like beta-propeller repeat protein [Armatimonadota bacterium]
MICLICPIRLIFSVICFALLLPACAADWPQFRGAGANGFSAETGLRRDWTARPPKVRWIIPLTDDGFAGPAVAAGTVYLMDHQGAQDIVRALDMRTGRERWRFSYSEAIKPVYGYARATPTIRGGKVYTLSRQGKAHCLDAATGKKLWARDILTDFKGVLPQWGYSMSPLVDGDALIVCPGARGAAVAALDRHTGKTLWKGGGSDIAGYATPVAATIEGKKQYVIFAGAALFGVDARTGARLWRFPWETELDPVVDTPNARAHFNANAAAPIVIGNTVFITTGYGHGSALIEIANGKAIPRWTSKEMQSQYSSPILADGYVYCTSDGNTLVCLEVATGKVAWKQTGINRGGGLIAAAGLLFVMDGTTGELIMTRLSPDHYQELGRCKPLGKESRTAPVIADGCLLVRNRKALACVEMK